jgi:hypothetical protein
MRLPEPSESRPDASASRVLAWCDALEAVRDKARADGDDFLAYLVEAALEHAIALAMRGNAGLASTDRGG